MALSHYSVWYDNITGFFFVFQSHPESLFLFWAVCCSWCKQNCCISVFYEIDPCILSWSLVSSGCMNTQTSIKAIWKLCQKAFIRSLSAITKEE